MTSILIPPLTEEPWPTLGPEVCDFITDYLVHGPGDVLGEPITLTREQQAVIWRIYEVYPKDHDRAGRRRFKRVGLSRRKGWSKTELAAWLAIVEAHPEGPVRCDGFNGDIPVGRPVRDPYIPMVATTEEQTEDLAYGAVYAILTEDGCEVAGDFDPGLERTRVQGSGEIKPLASAPSARDGARTTWQHFDEIHLFNSDRLINSHRTMLRNIPKRKAADAWSFETTTSFAPGEGSVAESLHVYAERVVGGEVDDPSLYYDHLQADETFDITKVRELEAAIVQASGDALAFADIPAIMAEFNGIESESRRYWLNQPRARADSWIPPARWGEGVEAPKDGEVFLGFWGGVNRDSAGFVAANREGYCWVVESWEPVGVRVTADEVRAALETALEDYDVAEIVTSRTGGSGFISEIEDWADTYPVVEIPVNSPARMGPACDRVYTAVHEGDLTHDGNPTLARHVANCVPAKSVHGTYIRSPENAHITLARALVLAYERAMAAEQVEDKEPLAVWV